MTRQPTVAALCIAWLLIAVSLPLPAAGPPETPLLRLETGTHSAPIKGIASDRAGRWIASASHDKTLRLWDAVDGRLLKTYRLPIGAGNEGKLYAVAMDPDGAWIAAGGWNKLGYTGSGNHNIFILDRASGRLLHRIDGLENVINHLCVSADGHRLAAMLGGGQGLRVHAPGDGFREIFADRDYGAGSYGCAFAADGRLVTTNEDGKLRLYAPDGNGLRRTAVQPGQGGKDPSGVAFHPDGDRIAVGFSDSTRVDLVDGTDLRLLHSADTAGITNGTLSSVAWSRDGRRLLAGGTYDDGSGDQVLSWDRAGRGPRHSWTAAHQAIMDLAPLPDGGLAVGTGDPTLLVFDRNGDTRLRIDPAIADLRGKRGDAFRLAADARRIAFGLGYGAKDPVWLDLDERRLHRGSADGADPVRAVQQALDERGYAPGPIDGDLGPTTRAAAARFRRDQGIGGSGINATLHQALGIRALAPPRIQAPGLAIRGWKNTREPTLNGTPLALDQYETARSLAIAPDGGRFLLGADWSLRLFERNGKQRWEKSVPGIA